jgi:hypothetical protein
MHVRGTAYALLAYDVGFQIDLDAAQARINDERRRKRFKNRRRVPRDEGQIPTPLRITQLSDSLDLGTYRTDRAVDIVLYEFGGICVSYALTVAGELDELVEVSDLLYDNGTLLDDSRARVEQLLSVISDAVEKPKLSPVVEDYVIFEIWPVDHEVQISDFWTSHGSTMARILRAEPGALSEQEMADALSHRISYGPDDASLVDWFAAVLIGEDMEDERVVLEYAVVELLELRFLDAQLDQGLDDAYDLLSRRRTWLEALTPLSDDLQRVAQLQAESATLFEGVNNTLKLLGDQYLARLYGLVSSRFHLHEWDPAIERKLTSLESVYEKISDRAGQRRFEALEWIIILLIAIDVLFYFLPVKGPHH